MTLEFRDKDGFYLFSVYGELVTYFFGYLIKEKRFTIENRIYQGVSYRCFVNGTNESLGGKNDFIEVNIRPGGYVKLIP